MRTRIAVVFALVLAGSSSHAEQASVPDRVKAAANRINAQQLWRDLEFLASDELAGRNTPSPGFDKAASYISDRLRRAGLKPASQQGTYLQHYTMREATADTEKSYIEIDGKRFRFGDDFVLRSFAGPVTGAFKAIYVGHGWTLPERGIDPYAGIDLRGKILLAHGPRALPKGIEIGQIGRITPGARSAFAEAEKRGAVGVIFLPQASALANWEQMRTQNTRMRELEPRVPSAYAAQPVTSLLLSRAAADALLAGEPNSADLMAKGETRDYPASFELTKPITLGITTATSYAHRPYNVVAILEGTDPVLKDEYITVEAHLDGAVGSRVVAGDGIYNAADDNASGSAATLSIAEQMVKVRPKRSIIFIWDSGEEQGLWGTRHFVANPPVPLNRIVAHFNVDMIGATRAPGTPDAAEERVTGPNEVFLIGPGVLSAGVDALLDRANRDYLNITFNRAFDRPDSEFFYPRTDAGPFLERGILTIGFFTGIHSRYHLPSDEARFLDPKKIETVARAVFVSIWTLADAAQRPAIDKPIPPTVPRYGVAAAPSRDDGWRLADPESVGVDANRLVALTSSVKAWPELGVHAILIERSGRLIYEEYFDGFDERWGSPLGRVSMTGETLHDVRSITKSVVSALAGIAVAEGAIKSLDQPVVGWFPEYADLNTAERRRVTLAHVLSMTSGLEWNEQVPYNDPRNDEIRMTRDPDPLRYALSRPFVHAPGAAFNYNGGLTHVMAAVIERATKTPIEEYARTKLFQPLGISSFEWLGDLAGMPAAASGLRLRARDIAKFGSLFLNRGQWNRRQVLPPEWIEVSTRRHFRSADRTGVDAGGQFGYGYFWWYSCYPSAAGLIEARTAVGNGQQRIFVLPGLDMVVTILAGRYNDFTTGVTLGTRILREHILPAVKTGVQSGCPAA